MRTASVVAFAIVASWAWPAPAPACTCVASPLCERLWADPAATTTFFEGTVEAVSAPAADGRVSVRLRDLKALRGDAPADVLTQASEEMCGYAFTVGERYLIEGWWDADGTVSTGRCSSTARLAASNATLAYLGQLREPARGGRIFGTAFSDAVVSSMFYENDRRPLGGVRVRLSGPVDRETTTRADGSYAFDRLPPGTYHLAPATPSGQRLLNPLADPIVLPNGYACSERRLVFERPRR